MQRMPLFNLQGLLRLVAALTIDKSIEIATGPFSTELEWFAQRFESFHCIMRSVTCADA